MSFLTLLFYIFCTFIRPQEWVPFMYGWTLIDVLAIATLFFIFIERSAGGSLNLIKVPQNKMLTGFFMSIMLSHIVHTYFAGLTVSFTSFLPTLILYFLLLNGVTTERKLSVIVWTFILMIALLVAQGVYQIQHGYGWAWQPLTIQGDGQGGVVQRINWIGIFGDPNDLALIYVIALGMVLPFFFGKSGFFTKIISLGLGGGFCWGVYLTNSRGGLLALMATLFFFFVKKTKKFILGGIVGGMAIFAILVLGPSRMGSISSSEASASTRIDLWYEGLQMFKSSPIFGVGHGMFMDSVAQTAHNSYVLAFAELGLLGLFFWIGLFYFSYKGLSEVQKQSPVLHNYALGVQSAMIGFSAAAFFLSRTYVIIPYLLFSLSGSMMYILQQKNKDIVFSIKKKDVRNIFLLSIAMIVAVVITIRGR